MTVAVVIEVRARVLLLHDVPLIELDDMDESTLIEWEGDGMTMRLNIDELRTSRSVPVDTIDLSLHFRRGQRVSYRFENINTDGGFQRRSVVVKMLNELGSEGITIHEDEGLVKQSIKFPHRPGMVSGGMGDRRFEFEFNEDHLVAQTSSAHPIKRLLRHEVVMVRYSIGPMDRRYCHSVEALGFDHVACGNVAGISDRHLIVDTLAFGPIYVHRSTLTARTSTVPIQELSKKSLRMHICRNFTSQPERWRSMEAELDDSGINIDSSL